VRASTGPKTEGAGAKHRLVHGAEELGQAAPDQLVLDARDADGPGLAAALRDVHPENGLEPPAAPAELRVKLPQTLAERLPVVRLRHAVPALRRPPVQTTEGPLERALVDEVRQRVEPVARVLRSLHDSEKSR
jgi:hypothetical protein